MSLSTALVQFTLVGVIVLEISIHPNSGYLSLAYTPNQNTTLLSQRHPNKSKSYPKLQQFKSENNAGSERPCRHLKLHIPAQFDLHKLILHWSD